MSKTIYCFFLIWMPGVYFNLTAYEASMQNLSTPNMYVFRTIIDVCGLCGDYIKARYIYEVLSPTVLYIV